MRMVVRLALPDTAIDRNVRALTDATRRELGALLLADEPASDSANHVLARCNLSCRSPM